jgi:hypothetical protein
MDSLFFKNSWLNVFPQGAAQKKNKNLDTFRSCLSSEEVSTFLDTWKMLKWILYFSKIFHWKYFRSGASQKNKNQGTFRIWLLSEEVWKFLYISRVFKNWFFIFQKFFEWTFSRRAQNRKKLIKIHFAFDLLLEEVCKLLDI